MASKATTNRKRIMRSAILTASMLSLIPLVGVMQSAATKTDSSAVAAVTSAGEPLTASPVSYETAPAAVTASTESTATKQPVTTASATTTQQTMTATQTTAASSYTRTKAS